MKFQFLPENFSRSENAPPFETRKIRLFEVERIFLKNKKMLDHCLFFNPNSSHLFTNLLKRSFRYAAAHVRIPETAFPHQRQDRLPKKHRRRPRLNSFAVQAKNLFL